MASATPDLRLPSQPQDITTRWLVPSYKGKGSGLYSAFIEVPYTQGAQVRITQCYLQTTPYLPLPRKHSPDGASQTEVAEIQLQPTTHLSTPKG